MDDLVGTFGRDDTVGNTTGHDGIGIHDNATVNGDVRADDNAVVNLDTRLNGDWPGAP